jgi:hypothetical protein
MILSKLTAIRRIHLQVSLEIHGGMEHANDLKGFTAAPEENDMTAFRRDPAPRKQIRALPTTGGIGTDGFESFPDPAKIEFLLLATLGFECVFSDGTKILQSRLGEGHFHASSRTRAMN